MAITFGREGDTELRFDRRQGQPETAAGHHPDRRVRSPREFDLRERGYLVISQFVNASASR